MLTIGSHLSSSKGYLAMAREAAGMNANTFQFFTRNPRGGRAKALDPGDVAAFLEFAKEHGIGPVLAHASYTLNPATADPKLRAFVLETIADDLGRLEHTPGNMYNIHPGSHTGRGVEAGIESIAQTLDTVLEPESRTAFLLETMSGHGSEVGGSFEELRAIIDASKYGKRLGVCLDTCHVFAAGYDIVKDLDGVLKHFDAVVGLGRLKAIHLNDSMFGPGQRKDRHAKIGEGEIGLDAFARIINHPALREIPFLLETPNDVRGWAEEIATLRGLYKEKEPGKTPKTAKPAKTAAKRPAREKGKR